MLPAMFGGLVTGTIAGRIAEAREAAGLTQKGLAEKISRSPSAVSGYELGTRGVDVADILAIAEATCFNPVYLAFGTPPRRDGDEVPDAASSPRFDADLLYRCIVAMERFISAENLKMPSESKARAIIGLYEMAARAPQEDVDALLNRIAPLARR